jgi:hypothetical protein
MFFVQRRVFCSRNSEAGFFSLDAVVALMIFVILLPALVMFWHTGLDAIRKIAGMLMGIFYMRQALVSEPGDSRSKAEAKAFSFAAYRDAVHKYAFARSDEEGEIPAQALSLPAGVAVSAWRNRLARDGGYMLCYVYGSASSEEIAAIFSLLKNSAAIGWNDSGRLIGTAPSPNPEIALPAFIGNGDIVSVITLK